MRIIDLDSNDQWTIDAAAGLLVEGFKEHWPRAWPDMAAALEEVREALEPGRIARVAVDDNGEVSGWIGGIPQYNGNVWELHPLVVQPGLHRRGIGRALVRDRTARGEAEVRPIGRRSSGGEPAADSDEAGHVVRGKPISHSERSRSPDPSDGEHRPGRSVATLVGISSPTAARRSSSSGSSSSILRSA